jgi:hypothetical protein
MDQLAVSIELKGERTINLLRWQPKYPRADDMGWFLGQGHFILGADISV